MESIQGDEQKANYICRFMARACNLPLEQVTPEVIFDYVKTPSAALSNQPITAILLWLLHLYWEIPCSELLWTFLDNLMLYESKSSCQLKPHIRPNLHI